MLKQPIKLIILRVIPSVCRGGGRREPSKMSLTHPLPLSPVMNCKIFSRAHGQPWSLFCPKLPLPHAIPFSCHISLKAASHGPISNCSLVLTELLLPVPGNYSCFKGGLWRLLAWNQTCAVTAREHLETFLEDSLWTLRHLTVIKTNKQTKCHHQRQHNPQAYGACSHLTEILKILRADSPQLFVKRPEIKSLQSVVWALNEREN